MAWHYFDLTHQRNTQPGYFIPDWARHNNKPALIAAKIMAP